MPGNDTQDEDRNEQSQVVAFRLGREIYGIEILYVQEVLHSQRVTSIPNAPYFVQGVIVLRGVVIPIVDLRKRLSLPEAKSPRRRIIVIDLEGSLLGLLVDDVYKVLRINQRDREIVPAAVIGETDRNCFSHLVKTRSDGLLILVAPDRILSYEEKITLDALASESEVATDTEQEMPSAR